MPAQRIAVGASKRDCDGRKRTLLALGDLILSVDPARVHSQAGLAGLSSCKGKTRQNVFVAMVTWRGSFLSKRFREYGYEGKFRQGFRLLETMTF